MTAALGLSAEAGEFTEVVKKIVFQGKPYNEENIFHMKRELGDIMWYLAQACMALDISIDEVMGMNFDKLSARYPEGTFSIERSENRVESMIPETSTLDDYKKAGEEFCLSIGMLPKNLERMLGQKTFSKLWKQLVVLPFKFSIDDNISGPFGFNKKKKGTDEGGTASD